MTNYLYISANIFVIILLAEITFQASTYTSKIDASLICDMCPPGSYKYKDCTYDSKTVCLPCGDGEYTSYNNSLAKCLRCDDCYDENEVTAKPCDSTSNTICKCMDGYTKDNTISACVKTSHITN
ncbi:TNFR-like protein [Finch poxvirus]|uniref:TNFR-like protein n=2 Tax=unclassified Avipoxvirus TaxID=336487 RepID=A0AAT9UQ84_9POXV|nr:TNFR-like protein [Finch poxvirus]UOX39050.1 TNFR-like protein [Finch poxvirus]